MGDAPIVNNGILHSLPRQRALPLVARPRLLSKIDEAGRARLLWIHSPAGGGKTSLIDNWLESRRTVVLRHQLRVSSTDPATLLAALALDAHRVCTQPSRLPTMTAEYLVDLPAFARLWVNALNTALPRPAVIVLDDYHRAPVDSPLHAVIETVIGALDSGITLIIASRAPPPPLLAAWQTDPDFRLLDWEDLRLTGPEANELARGHGLKNHAIVDEFNARARGWIAGVILQLVAWRRGVAPADAAMGTQQTIFELLSTQIFAGLSPAQRKRLVVCAIPSAISSRAAREVAGIEACDDLAAMHAARQFIDRRVEANGREVYEFHPLMRGFLQSRIDAVIAPEVASDLRRRIAVALERDEQLEDALAQWTEIAAWDEVIRIVITAAPVLLAQGRYQTLDQWIDSLPNKVVVENGWLLYWRGVARALTNPPVARGDVEAAYDRFSARCDDVGALCAAAEILKQRFAARGDYADIDSWLDRVEQHYACVESALTPALEATIITSLGVCCDIGLAHSIWVRVQHRLNALLLAVDDPTTVARLSTFGMQLARCRGDLVSARRSLSHFELALTDPHSAPAHAIAGLAEAAMVDAIDGQFAEALVRCQRALSLIDQHSLPALRTHVACAAFYAKIGADDLDGAATVLAQLVPPHAHASATLRAQIDTMRALLLFCRGEPERAVDAMRAPLAVLSRIGAMYLAIGVRTQLGETLWLSGRHDEARVQLRRVLEEASVLKAEFMAYAANLYIAGSMLDTAESAAALQALRQAMAIGGRHDYLNTYPLWNPHAISKILAAALAHGIESEYVRRVIRRRKLSSPDAAALAWPWPIRVYTLGRFALFIGEARFDHGRKAQRRVLDLLKAIIAFGGIGVGRDQLATALWPDSEGADGINALEVTLYRLRKVLGRDDAIRLEQGEVSLNRRAVWVDAYAFDELAVLAGRKEAGTGRDPDEWADAARKAIDLYYGSFLPFEEPSQWLLPYQERLRSRFRRLLVYISREWPALPAIDALSRAIEIDPAGEELHRRLIAILIECGRQAEGVEAFQRCDRMLRATVGVAPSTETRAVLQRLGPLPPARALARRVVTRKPGRASPSEQGSRMPK
jgi:LuxR family transcriptional regulator, maltose regulon positive regulatory protein